MENERQLLGMYVNVGEYRRNISMPFRQDGRICATDGHMMIRIAEGLCEGEYTDMPFGLKTPDTNSVMPEPNMCEDVTAEMLEHALENAPKEKERKCPECGGSGTVDYTYCDRFCNYHTVEDDCPECDGTGEVSDYTVIRNHFTLHGNALCYHHLKTLLRTMRYLQTGSLRLRYMQKEDGHSLALLFDVEGKDIEILVMPQIRDRKMEEIKIETI